MRLRFASRVLGIAVVCASKATAVRKNLSTLDKLIEEFVEIAHDQGEEEKAADGEEEPREAVADEVNQLREIVRGQSEEEILTKIAEIVRRQMEEEKKAAEGEEEPRENKVPGFADAPVLRDDAKRTGHEGAAIPAGGDASFIKTEDGDPSFWYYRYPKAAALDRDGTSPQTRFEYLGQGTCKTRSGHPYTRITAGGETDSPHECANNCLASPHIPYIAGYEWKESQDENARCICLVDRAYTADPENYHSATGYTARIGDPEARVSGMHTTRCYERRYNVLAGL